MDIEANKGAHPLEGQLGSLIDEVQVLATQVAYLPEGDERTALNQRIEAHFQQIDNLVAAHPELLAFAWEKLEAIGYGGDAYYLALHTARAGKSMPEDALHEHVSLVMREQIAKLPDGEQFFERAMHDVSIARLNERHGDKAKLADQLPSPTEFQDIGAVRARIKKLLEDDGVVDTARFETTLERRYGQKVFDHFHTARDRGEEKEFIEKFPAGMETRIWKSCYLSYVHNLFEEDRAKIDMHTKHKISAKEAFEYFSPEVLLAMLAGEEGKEIHGKTDRDRLGSRDNWSAADKAEIVRRVLESEGIKDGLSLIDVLDLPLPDSEKYKAEFYTAYLKRAPDKILENVEFFEDLVRTNGQPEEAVKALDSKAKVNIPPTSAIQLPTEAEVTSMQAAEVLKLVVANHDYLLRKMKKIDCKNLPQYGLSGGDSPDRFLGRAAANERLYLQFVSTVEAVADPNLALIDLYDTIGGDKSYFANKDYSLFVMDITEPRHERLNDYWGSDGEFKNWSINVDFYGQKPLEEVRTLPVALKPEHLQVFRYFEETKTRQRRPHAEKTSREYPAGTSKDEMAKRVIGRIDANDTPLYLLEKNYQLLLADPETPNVHKRQMLTEVLYVQAVAEKVLDALTVRMAA